MILTILGHCMVIIFMTPIMTEVLTALIALSTSQEAASKSMHAGLPTVTNYRKRSFRHGRRLSVRAISSDEAPQIRNWL